MSEQLHVTITGRVQGVGFRASTQHRARQLGLTGWVRNLSGGRSVEAVFEGAAENLNQMEQWCRSGPPWAEVVQVDAERRAATGDFEGFRIRY